MPRDHSLKSLAGEAAHSVGIGAIDIDPLFITTPTFHKPRIEPRTFGQELSSTTENTLSTNEVVMKCRSWASSEIRYDKSIFLIYT